MKDSILPLCQSLRNPRLQEADNLTQRFLWRRRGRRIISLSCAVLATYYGLVFNNTISDVNKTPFVSSQYSSPLSDEPNMFTPRIVLDAIIKNNNDNLTNKLG
mmetsp:Transcript_1079/g.1375  ORF Transcript_1079/g.1375 Transcript_1079/m.1375 type:complete len:103 (-) Transcript_1079:212-520(-)